MADEAPEQKFEKVYLSETDASWRTSRLLESQHEYIRQDIAAARVQAARREVWREAIECVPTNWLDTLLTGPDAVVQPPLNTRHVEAVLQGVKARMESCAAGEGGEGNG